MPTPTRGASPAVSRHFSSSPAPAIPCFKPLKKRLALVPSSPSPSPKAFRSYVEICASVLRRCAAADRCLGPLGRAVQAHALKSGISSDFSISSKLIEMYSRWGCPDDRDRAFLEADGFSLFSWNFMIAELARSGDLEAARRLFDGMPERNVVSWTVMADGHMKCGKVRESMEYFERNPFRSVISYTAMISGFVQNGLPLEALSLFRRMLVHGMLPNEVTFTSVLKACIVGGEFECGKSVLGLVVKTSFERHLSVCNSLITFCVRLGDVDAAIRVFDGMEQRDVVSWTALLDVHAELGNMKEARLIFEKMPGKNEVSWSMMVSRYGQNGEPLEAIKLFSLMLRDGCMPNRSCLAGVISASADLENLLFGTSIHCLVTKVGFEKDFYVSSSLIDMYCKCKRSDDARQVFDTLTEKSIVCWNSMIAGYSSDGKIQEATDLFSRMPTRNLITWNALISGYAQNERFIEVLETFDNMLLSGETPNSMTFSSVLQACANLPSLVNGKKLHGKILKLGIQSEVFIGTALTDMYAKSGEIDSAKKVFSIMPKKNEISWTAMIQGLADNGLAEECILLFEGMKNTDINPSEPMFLSVLSACSHCGFLDKGFHYFMSMEKECGITPNEKHYTCMVDLLARAGRLREAEEFISKMPIRPEANSWAALLSACSTFMNKEIGERAAVKFLELEEDTAGYVLLSNIYASCGRWKDVANVRLQLRNVGIKKGGGCSLIQIRNQFHTFFSWDVNHPESSEVYRILELLTLEMVSIKRTD